MLLLGRETPGNAMIYPLPVTVPKSRTIAQRCAGFEPTTFALVHDVIYKIQHSRIDANRVDRWTIFDKREGAHSGSPPKASIRSGKLGSNGLGP